MSDMSDRIDPDAIDPDAAAKVLAHATFALHDSIIEQMVALLFAGDSDGLAALLFALSPADRVELLALCVSNIAALVSTLARQWSVTPGQVLAVLGSEDE